MQPKRDKGDELSRRAGSRIVTGITAGMLNKDASTPLHIMDAEEMPGNASAHPEQESDQNKSVE